MRSACPTSALRIAVLGLALALGACASTAPGNRVVAASPGEDSDATEFGNYLSARHAASQHDLKDASSYFRASLAQDPANKDLLALSFFFATSSGDIEEASRLAERVVAAQADDRAGRLTLAVEALKKRNYADARKQIGLSAKGPFSSLTVSLARGGSRNIPPPSPGSVE